MSKRITFSASRESTIKSIDKYCKVTGKSRSKVISSFLNAMEPLLKKITNVHELDKELEFLLSNLVCEKDGNILRSKPHFTKEEYFLAGWNETIIHPENIVDDGRYEHKVNTSKIGMTEKEEIKTKLLHYINVYGLAKAIYIYTDRKVNYKYHLAGGLSNVILIKHVVFDDHIYDFNKIIILPLPDLINFGINESLKINDIYAEHPYVCWIPIYYTNNQAVMIPIIHRRNAPQSSKNNKDTIIINPFVESIIN